jgi:hypothetical protein
MARMRSSLLCWSFSSWTPAKVCSANLPYCGLDGALHWFAQFGIFCEEIPWQWRAASIPAPFVVLPVPWWLIVERVLGIRQVP